MSITGTNLPRIKIFGESIFLSLFASVCEGALIFVEGGGYYDK